MLGLCRAYKEIVQKQKEKFCSEKSPRNMERDE